MPPRGITRGLPQQSFGFRQADQTCLLAPGNEIRNRIKILARYPASFSAHRITEIQAQVSPYKLELFGRRGLGR